jgi:prepilin-type N-terminal cleavage/methylation domain-containing protein
MCRATDRGFTLLELIVGLTVAAIVIMLAHRMSTAVIDGAATLDRARVSLDRSVNAVRTLGELFGSLDIGREMGGFEGHPDRAEFSSWERTATGWLEPRRVALGLSRDTLVLQESRRTALRSSVSGVAFDYLLEPGANSVWVREWVSPVSAPIAIRIRLAGRLGVDTLLFLIGPRG